jgi:zinc transport system substrate-binding protein
MQYNSDMVTCSITICSITILRSAQNYLRKKHVSSTKIEETVMKLYQSLFTVAAFLVTQAFAASIAHAATMASQTSASSQENVFVSILPQKLFVQQIGGNLLNIEVMVQPGASPATYEPKPSQMRKLAASKAYFAIGVPFEKAWLDKIAGVNQNMHIIHTDSEIEKITMGSHHHEEQLADHHESGTDHEEHSGLDPHIWLSPILVKQQAATILDGLITLFPQHKEVFQTNYKGFIDRIDTLHDTLKNLFGEQQSKEFMVFHPSWGYFAREYGLTQVPIEIEGKSPKPAQLSELINHALEQEITVIFAQEQFSTKNARIIARAIGGKVVLVDPLALDWFANMEHIGTTFKNAAQ